MKRCPECGREYDLSMSFCLDDGTELLYGPALSELGAVATGFRASDDAPATAILHSTDAPGDAPTRAQIHTTTPADAPHISQSTSNELPGRRLSASKVKIPLVIGGLFVVLCLAGFGLYRYQPWAKAATPHFKNITLKRITTEGGVESVALSPDGKYIAYSLEESGKRSLWTKHLATESRVQIAAPVEAISMYASCFSPDGSYVYYTRQDDENPRGALYSVPVLGGQSKKILSDVSQPVALSRDGKQILFGRFKLEGTDDHLMLADSTGANERVLVTVREPDYLQGSSAAWSPDGTKIAIGYGSLSDSSGPSPVYKMKVAVVSLANPVFVPVTQIGWGNVGKAVWLEDGSGIAFVAGERRSSLKQIWQCLLPSGEASRITNDLNSYDFESLSITADDSAIAAVQKHPASQIWIAPDGDISKAHPVVTRKNVQDGRFGIAWTPDGRLVYDSVADSDSTIWSIKPDGTEPRQLTDGTSDDFAPEVSPDGRFIIFGAVRNGFQIWRMDIDGANARQMTFGSGAPTFSYSPDGRWIVMDPYQGGIWKMDSSGGDPMQVVKDGALVYPQVSPNGRMIAYRVSDKDTKRPRINIINFDDGALLKQFDLPVSSAPPFFDSLSYRGFHWSPDGSGIVYIDTAGGVSNLWRIPLDGGPAKKITDFKSDRIFNFAYASDGRTIAFARGSDSPDAVLITDSK